MTGATDVRLRTIVLAWGRIGCLGFGGPPAHIALLRRLCVTERAWLTPAEFEDGVAATNLLPGPASTQLAIFCAWRLRGWRGALLGGISFILPGLVLILLLAALLLAGRPPEWVRAAAAGAGAAVGAVAVHAAAGLVPTSWHRADRPHQHQRWLAYFVLGAAGSVLVGPWLVLVLAGCGLVEVGWRRARRPAMPLLLAPLTVAPAGLAAVAWVALKVGALSYGGGFVIIPLMQSDAVAHYHWLTGGQFLDAVALGQITPGPVVQTVAVVGYAAGGLLGGVLAAIVAFTPSFLFVLAGASGFARIRANNTVGAFLDGAGPAAIGAIGGAAITLAMALHQWWQWGVLALAAVWLLVFRRGVVTALLGAAALGVLCVLVGAPLSVI